MSETKKELGSSEVRTVATLAKFLARCIEEGKGDAPILLPEYGRGDVPRAKNMPVYACAIKAKKSSVNPALYVTVGNLGEHLKEGENEFEAVFISYI